MTPLDRPYDCAVCHIPTTEGIEADGYLVPMCRACAKRAEKKIAKVKK